MLQPGRYKAEKEPGRYITYCYILEVRETEKSYIFKLISAENWYDDNQIELLFKGKDRAVLRKDKPNRHAMRVWSDHDFTIYPFQCGVPFYFQKEDES